MNQRRGIPRRPIFWTIDQIADMLALPESTLRNSYLWLEGQDRGIYRKQYLRAVNLRTGALAEGTHYLDWRVPEDEFLRWLDFNRLWILDPTSAPALSFQENPQTLTISEDTGTMVDIVEPSPEEPHE